MEAWLAERYLSSRVDMPGPLLQSLLNAYIAGYHWLEKLMQHRWGNVVTETAAIAKHSEALMDIHYNMPRGMFEHMLGPTMKYSMALWERGARTLEAAQAAMLDDVIAKAGLRDGDRVLDIGCGFGSFAAHALRRLPRVKVQGLTLSDTQAGYIREKQNEPAHPLHSDRFAVIQDDFNRVVFDQRFDCVVSIGVFEHVTNLDNALEKIRSFLAPGGRCFLHYIVFTPAVGLPGLVARQDSFVNRYVFPDGRIWAEGELFRHQRALRIEDHWFVNGINYRDTLRVWLANFLRYRESVQEGSELDERSLRIWELYLRACIAMFNIRGGRAYGNGQYLLRPATGSQGDSGARHTSSQRQTARDGGTAGT